MKVTPGPYRLSELDGGVEVRGINGVSVAWFGQAMTCGTGGSYRIDGAECLANASVFVDALKQLGKKRATPSDHPWRERDRAALAEGAAKRKGVRRG